MAKTILLVGAGGFIGRHLSAQAEAGGWKLAGASREAGSGLSLDLLDPASIEAALAAAQPDCIVNLAGAASVGRSWAEPAEAFELNAIGVLNLLAATAKAAPEAHLLCVSSGEVYGRSADDGTPLGEEEPMRPLNPYGSSKAAMELICGQWERSHGLRIAVLRTFNQIGPGQSEAFVAPDFARQIAEAEARGEAEMTLEVGNLSVRRDFSDVRDGAGAFLAVLERGLTGTFNVCSGQAIALEDLVAELGAAARLNVSVQVDPARFREADAPVLCGSPARIEKEAGWHAEIPLKQTIEDLLDSARAAVSHA